MSTSQESDLHSLPSSDTNTLITPYKYTYSFYAKRKPRKGIHKKRAGYTRKTNRSAVDGKNFCQCEEKTEVPDPHFRQKRM